MAHYGIVCHPIRGRLYPQLAMGQALRDEGHRVTVLAMEETHSVAVASGLEVIRADNEDGETISMRRYPNRIGIRHRLGLLSVRRLRPVLGLFGVRLNLYSRSFNAVYDRMIGFDLDRVFSIIRDGDFDCIIASDTSFACRTICEQLGIPMISSCTGIPLSVDRNHPPEYMSWRPPRSRFDRLRNRLAHRATRLVEAPGLARLNAARRRLYLEPHRDFSRSLSKLAYLSQIPEGFGFPQRDMGVPMHHLGPTLRVGSREPTPFPWDELDGRPMVYVSAGTVNDLEGYFSRIAEACADLPVQVVITRGGGTHPIAGTLPGDPLVVDYAPQLEVIKRASLVVTHGSANTMLETLAAGVPLLCIPQALDQFGTGVRLEASGAGISLGRSAPPVGAIREAVERMLSDEGIRKRAGDFKDDIEASDPVGTAVMVIETARKRYAAQDDCSATAEPFDVVMDDGRRIRAAIPSRSDGVRSRENSGPPRPLLRCERDATRRHRTAVRGLRRHRPRHARARFLRRPRRRSADA